MSTSEPALPPVPSPADRTPAEAAMIADVLQRAMPTECDIAGGANVEDVAHGAEFRDVKDGHHMSVGTVLTVLATAAALVHDAITIYKFVRGLRGGAAAAAGTGGEVAGVVQALRERYAGRPDVGRLLQDDPSLFERIVKDVAEVVARHGGRDADAS